MFYKKQPNEQKDTHQLLNNINSFMAATESPSME
jgi:hypothetical protein